MPTDRATAAPRESIIDFDADAVTAFLLEGDRSCRCRLSAFLPMVRAGDTQKNALRAKNLLKDADEKLEQAGLGKRARTAYTVPLERLLSGREFKEHQDDGLAILAEPERCLVMRCPQRFVEQVVVDEQYHVLPLLHLLAEPPEFTVLAISRNSVRVIDGCRGDAEDSGRPLDGMPRSLTEVAGHDVRQDSLQQHSPQATGPAIFHGQGAGEDDELPELERYCSEVATALEKAYGTNRRTVLAGDVRLLAVFRRYAAGLCLTARDIDGNHDRTPARELAARGWEIVRDEVRDRERELVDRFDQDVGRQRASAAEHLIPDAAENGRIEVLLVDAALAASRAYAPRDTAVPPAVNPRIANLAALATLQNGGGVRAIRSASMPRAAALAALLRY